MSALAELFNNVHPALILFSAVAGFAPVAGILCHWDLERRRLALLDKLAMKAAAEPSVQLDLTELLRPAPQPRTPNFSLSPPRHRSTKLLPTTAA